MKLFKCFDPFHISDHNQCLFVWAKNQKAALRKSADIVKKLDIYYAPVKTVTKEWEIEEYFIPKESDVYVCYPKDFDKAYEIQVISVPFDVQDIESYVMDKLIEIECQDENFIEYVNEKACNMSFNESFYCDKEGWVYSPTPPLEAREDVKIKAKAANKTVDEYIDDLWINNINEFFGEETNFKNEYINYITSDEEPCFNHDFYFYVCKTLMEKNQWTSYPEIRKADIVA